MSPAVASELRPYVGEPYAGRMRRFLETHRLWPQPTLRLKRLVMIDAEGRHLTVASFGSIIMDAPLSVLVDGAGETITYASADEMVEAGWTVD
jgi:hypothetical protein